MDQELQRLVDHLGTKLARSVAIDDPHIKLLAYTSHVREVDAARIGSIMRRSVPPALTKYLSELGIAGEPDVFRVPACPEIGLLVERIGIPIRYERSLLGYLWLVGSDGPVSDGDAEALRGAAARAALLLHRDHLLARATRGRERELARDLVSPDAVVRVEAAAALIEEELLVGGRVSALVATLEHGVDDPIDQHGRVALQVAVDHARRQLPPLHSLVLNRPDHSLLLAVWPGASSSLVEIATAELGTTLHSLLATEIAPTPGSSCWVGIGGTRNRLEGAHASYREARNAADVARITGAVGPIVQYSRLGVYGLLAKLTPDEMADGIHPGIRQLLPPHREHRHLLDTLRAYLDNAGDAQRTTEELHLHRSSLYHRLHRIEELANLDLSNGDDRLAAHLSLKLARLVPSNGPDGEPADRP